ncbi:MAG: response regulator transcription factor [Flavobacteriales bacterium]|jgi:DNA-binding NarL/FixJ family response regulator|nr:response regulator transcription factor [Flavobacteriales bacterium]
MIPIRLHIAESNFVVREGLKSVFGAEGNIDLVGITAKSDQLKSELMDSSPQVLLINYGSEGFHESDVVQAMRLIPGLKVIGMTHDCEVTIIRKLLESGLNGHLMSDCDQGEIIDSVISAAKGEKFFCGKVLDQLNDDFGDATKHGCDPVVISERELEILQLVAQGLTTKQIGEKIHISFHTVMTHRKNMMAKLGINNTAGLIIYAVRENLISPNRFLFSQNTTS